VKISLLAVLGILLMPCAAGIPLHYNQSLNERAAASHVIDPYLKEVLLRSSPWDRMGVVVQFDQEYDARTVASSYGINVKRYYSAINGIYGNGTKAAVIGLAGFPGVRWMEYNEKMVLLMHETTNVTNATKVWNTIPVWEGLQGVPIDGSGVTVAVVDTGIDAGHPDLDYGEKVIINLKSDMDGTYTEAEDTDTGSGHGTHCAGTIGGNGDASAGARRGMAPGAGIIGISTGEHFLQNVVGALNWVYEHSRPGNNPYNIRVVSNSWGSGAGEYDPNDAVTVIANRMTYENNVVVVFAAGNSGENDHDGHEITTSTYGNTPAIIEVAAALHEGDGIAYFSSRGQADLNQTWPDIAAPGYHIWATQARKTQITAMRNANSEDLKDAYYMSISGTSMATPHVSGLIALLWQAAPSMRVMDLHDDYAGDDESYWTNPETRIHEAEWIIEMTADYIPKNGDNGVPDNHSISDTHLGHKYDYAQGYGLINADRAVQLALTLEEMRRTDPNTTVQEAYLRMVNASGIFVKKNVTEATDTLTTQWFGEWGYLVDPKNALVTHHEHHVYIPSETKTLVIDLTYNPSSSGYWYISELNVLIDADGDGTPDWSGGNDFSNRGAKHYEIDPSSVGETGRYWTFMVEGMAIGQIRPKLPNILNNQYNEILVEYSIGLRAILDASNGTAFVPETDMHAAYSHWKFGEPSSPNATGNITMVVYCYDLSRIQPEESAPPPPVKEPDNNWWLALLALAALGALGYWYLKKKRSAPPQEEEAADESQAEDEEGAPETG